ncbi:MAG: VOC family protein [bacterium]|nr:VOC family protein [bacterium]
MHDTLIRASSQFLSCMAIALTMAIPIADAADQPPLTPPGTVIWWDLLTEDADAVMDFYSGIFGWEYHLHETGAWVVLLNDKPIAGISEIKDSLPEADESFWLAGIAVRNVDTAVEQARELGAKVRVDVDELPGFARYAVIEDPQSAPILLAKPLTQIGGATGHGAWLWTELWTVDVDAAIEFYGKVIGFETAETQVDGRSYQYFKTDDTARAGVLKTPYENVEPAWAPYIGVGKFPVVLEKVTELGGRVILEPAPSFGGGRVALVADPAGAALFVYNLEARHEVTR